jgi:hypothetical protein
MGGHNGHRGGRVKLILLRPSRGFAPFTADLQLRSNVDRLPPTAMGRGF